MAATDLREGVGCNQLWGFSAAIDLQSARELALDDAAVLAPLPGRGAPRTDAETREVERASGGCEAGAAAEEGDGGEWNALIVGAADHRHVLKTLARWRRWKPKRMVLYVHEETPEALGRLLLLLLVARDATLSVESRAQLTLELLGNLMLRAKTAEYLQRQAAALCAALRQELRDFEPRVDSSLLKFSDLDAVEATVRGWRDGSAQSKAAAATQQQQQQADLRALWDQRLRHFYGSRFDSRANLMDWDYAMRLRCTASVLHIVHYRRWRTHGLAFELRECEYTAPNRTLLTRREAIDRRTGRVQVRGYWGDIVLTPYLSFGIDTERRELLRVRSGQHTKTAVDVAEHNVASFIREWLTGQRPEGEEAARAGGEEKQAEEEVKLSDVAQQPEQPRVASEERLATQATDTGGAAPVEQPEVRLVLLTGPLAPQLAKPHFRRRFHQMLLSSPHAHLFTPALAESAAPGALISFDTLRFFPVLPEQKLAYLAKVAELAAACGATPASKTALAAPDAPVVSFRLPST